MTTENCPFCGCDPYHRVHNGVGMEAVAVTCCDLGADYFQGRLSPNLRTIGNQLCALIAAKDMIEKSIDQLGAVAEHIANLEGAADRAFHLIQRVGDNRKNGPLLEELAEALGYQTEGDQ